MQLTPNGLFNLPRTSWDVRLSTLRTNAYRLKPAELLWQASSLAFAHAATVFKVERQNEREL